MEGKDPLICNILETALPQAHTSTGLPYGSFRNTSGER